MSKKEQFSGDTSIDQKDVLSQDALSDGVPQAEGIIVERVLNSVQADNLLFNEEPVTIRLEQGSERNAPRWVYVAVNGKGAEVLVGNQWVEFKYLPVNQVITTRRKYVEVLARAKRDTILTNVIERENDDPQNMLERNTSSAALFSVIHDANPKGAPWLTAILRQTA